MVLINTLGLNFPFPAKIRYGGKDLCLGNIKNPPLVRVHTYVVDFQQKLD